MKTNKFEVTYPNGDTALVESTCTSAEEFIGQTFSTGWAMAEANGAKVLMIEEEERPTVTAEALAEAEETGVPPVAVVHEASGAVEGAGASSSGG